MTIKTLIAKCYPNAHKVSLMKYEDERTEDTIWVVRDPDTGYTSDDGAEYDTEAVAQAAYADAVKRWQATPNWEAQEHYDLAHGTINGYHPHHFIEY